MELQTGQVVKVFDDPISCKKFEGEAKLLFCYREEHHDNDPLSMWEVRFLDDGYETLRTINSETA